MLQIKNICKKYVTGDLVQMALDDVSLNFRDNEFVAVLGPSGSGKTTLLNIIGGLDRYDSGDLIINGISTKNYSDRDWDSYRNHTIGFVFQSYNLIPQQTVLANVEIALTISGVGRAERRQRAIEALKQVGLGDQIHKKPNQMSGGQMQRVAIARALINNPDILLADEPTGALDTETSVQVMDLLKEVAKDRMVIMVTHNPDLAEQYATRIVRLQDGRIIADSDPYVVDDTEMAPPVHKNMGYSSMNMMTSLGLSVNNLLVKRGRTFLTCFAGSIGIIAIALILAVSSGVNEYIATLEEDTMAEYPVEVTSSGFDISSMMSTMLGTVEQVIGGDEGEEDGIRVMTMISRMVNILDTNDLAPFKEYLESGETDIYEYAKAIEYIYDVEPQIYLEQDSGYHQVNPETTLTSSFGLGATLTDMMGSMMTMLSTFYQMPENEDLFIDSYEIKAGRWPEDYNECVLVVSSSGTIADYMVYTLGLRDYAEYEELIDDSLNGAGNMEVEYDEIYLYDDIVGTTYKLVINSDYYEYDSDYEVWTDKRDNESFMKQLVADGEDLTIVGVVQPLEDATTAILNEGINYPASLIEHIAAEAEQSAVVQDQLNHPDVNVLTGEEFGEDFAFDLTSMFEFDNDTFTELIDTDALMDTFMEELDFSSIDMGDIDLSEAFDLGSMDLSLDMSGLDLSSMMNIDMSALDMDMSGLSLDMNIDLSGMDLSSMDLDLESIMAGMDMSAIFDPSGIADLTESLIEGYEAYAASTGASTYDDLVNDFGSYLNSSSGQQLLQSSLDSMVTTLVNGITDDEVEELVTELLQNSSNWRSVLSSWITTEMGSSLSGIADSLASSLTSGFESYSSSTGDTTAGDISQGFSEYMSSPQAMQIMSQGMMELFNMDEIMSAVMDQMMGSMTAMISDQMESQINAAMASMSSQLESELTASMSGMMSGMEDQISSAMNSMMPEIESQMTAAMSNMDMSSMTDQLTESLTEALEESMSGDDMADAMAEAFEIDPDEIMEAFNMDMDEESLLEMMTSMSSAVGSSYEGVLADLGYVDYSNPTEIDIYPKDFDSKDGIVAIIDDYNVMVDEMDQEELEISYTDIMGTMMSTVTTIINLVTYVLIAFVAISLVVSCIMIGIITYISVLERTREIGILRALGASKRNVGRIFNAETFIVGLISGVLGVVIALIILIPVNMIIDRFVGEGVARAYLPFLYGVLLIVLSIVLTLIGGIIPSRKASKMDPVAALRSE